MIISKQNLLDYKILIAVVILSCLIFQTSYATNSTNGINKITITNSTNFHYAGNSKFIGLELSQTCLTQVKNNITTDCPTYKSLLKYDTSNQFTSGKFIPNGNDIKRTKPEVPLHYFFYYNKTVVFVDPPIDIMSLFPNIIIEPDNFVYKMNSDPYTNNTRIEYTARYMYGCSLAEIANIPGLINDTLNYFKSGCTAKLKFNEKHFIQQKEIPFEKINPYSSLHYKNMFQNIKKAGSMQICFLHAKQCKYKDVYSNW